jgi:hypothetical protein
MTADIYTKIERYSDIGFGLDLIAQEKQAMLDQVIPETVKQLMAEIDAEFEGKAEPLRMEREMLEAEIKAAVLEAGQSIKGTHHTFSWSKPRVSWDDKGLSGYALHHPEILQFRKVGNPSVSVRKA